MNYLTLALIVSFGSVMMSVITWTFIAQKKYGKTLCVGTVASIIYSLLLWWALWRTSTGVYGPTPLALPIIIGLIIGAIVSVITNEGKAIAPGIVGAVLILLYIFIFPVLGGETDWLTSQSKARLIGEVVIINGDLASVIEPADFAHLCEVPGNRANKAAQAALSSFKVTGKAIPGSRYEIGHPTIQYVDGQLWYIYPLNFRGWLKWRSDPQIPGFLRVSAEDSHAEAQAVQHNKQGEEIHIKYHNTACFEFNAERHLRTNGYMTTILKDWTFEVDDDWNPYYTVSILERIHGWTSYKVKGIVALNLQTGEHEKYSIDELPSWVDRATPLPVLDNQISKWGEYRNSGWWRAMFKHDQSHKPTDGWYMVYDNKTKSCKWYSGFTSWNKEDQALTGFILADTRTGKTTYYETKGVTEDEIFQAGDALWSESDGVKPTEIVPYNIHGMLTYFMPMTQNNQLVGFSLVDITNTFKARGTTVEAALDRYAEVVSIGNQKKSIPGGGQMKTVSISGVIRSCNLLGLINEKAVYGFTIDGINKKIFKTSYSSRNPEVAAITKGDEITITYLDTKEKVITCRTFDILSLDLSAENPEQARYEENRKTTDSETSRVNKIDDAGTILKGVDPTKVDPEALKKFIEEQATKTPPKN